MTAIVTSSLIPKTRTRDLAQRDDVVGRAGMSAADMLRVRCSTCGAPRTVLIGYHLARLLAAGGRPAVR